MNVRQELKNAAIFYTVGLPILIVLMFAWSVLTEAAGFIAIGLLVIYPIRYLRWWLKEKARA